MFARTFRRTVLAAAIALTLLVPAAQADNWAGDARPALDPSIANAIHDRAAAAPTSLPLDPALAIHDGATAASQPLPLDPALRNVVAEAASPANHAAAPQASVAPSATTGFAWSDFALGAGAAVASMLLLAALGTGARSVRQRRGVNAGAATT
jgi:hypothetical protein